MQNQRLDNQSLRPDNRPWKAVEATDKRNNTRSSSENDKGDEDCDDDDDDDDDEEGDMGDIDNASSGALEAYVDSSTQPSPILHSDILADWPYNDALIEDISLPGEWASSNSLAPSLFETSSFLDPVPVLATTAMDPSGMDIALSSTPFQDCESWESNDQCASADASMLSLEHQQHHSFFTSTEALLQADDNNHSYHRHPSTVTLQQHEQQRSSLLLTGQSHDHHGKVQFTLTMNRPSVSTMQSLMQIALETQARFRIERE